MIPRTIPFVVSSENPNTDLSISTTPPLTLSIDHNNSEHQRAYILPSSPPYTEQASTPSTDQRSIQQTSVKVSSTRNPATKHLPVPASAANMETQMEKSLADAGTGELPLQASIPLNVIRNLAVASPSSSANNPQPTPESKAEIQNNTWSWAVRQEPKIGRPSFANSPSSASSRNPAIRHLPVPAFTANTPQQYEQKSANAGIGELPSQASTLSNRDSGHNSVASTSPTDTTNISASLDKTGRKTIAMQWNICGFRGHFPEVQYLLNTNRPLVLALQETKCDENIDLPSSLNRDYKWLLKRGENSTTQHGVGLAILTDLPHRSLNIDTNLQAIAATVNIPNPTTFVTLYLPPGSSANETRTSLDQLVQQLPKPFIIMGDLNGHNESWGSHKNDNVGRMLESFMLDWNLTLLNNGEHTRLDPVSGSTSPLDLTIASSQLAGKFTWSVDNDTHGSDHYPTRLTVMSHISLGNIRQRWLLKEADWETFSRLTSDSFKGGTIVSSSEFIEKIKKAAEASIPLTSGKIGRKAVPWWNSTVAAAIKDRRKKLRHLRRLSDNHPNKQEGLRITHPPAL